MQKTWHLHVYDGLMWHTSHDVHVTLINFNVCISKPHWGGEMDQHDLQLKSWNEVLLKNVHKRKQNAQFIKCKHCINRLYEGSLGTKNNFQMNLSIYNIKRSNWVGEKDQKALMDFSYLFFQVPDCGVRCAPKVCEIDLWYVVNRCEIDLLYTVNRCEIDLLYTVKRWEIDLWYVVKRW